MTGLLLWLVPELGQAKGLLLQGLHNKIQQELQLKKQMLADKISDSSTLLMSAAEATHAIIEQWQQCLL